ncbi:MAG: helix-turn-helix domain-containing protein [Adlercreutzia sp.]|nr:helix-turn-helix domain-containing protein [Adlercreutzia sp.]
MKGPARAVPRAYGRLTRHERDTVQRMLERGASCREIATELGKSPSTASAEVASHSPAHAAIHARANAVPIAASHTARVAEVCSDTSRRLAPRSLARRAARVGAPVPQASPAAAQDPARIEPHGGARPSCSTLRQSASGLSPQLRVPAFCCHPPHRSVPAPGLAPQGTRRTIRTTIHARQSALLRIRPRIC